MKSATVVLIAALFFAPGVGAQLPPEVCSSELMPPEALSDYSPRRVIHFEKEPDPPRSPGTDFVIMGDTHVWVEEL